MSLLNKSVVKRTVLERWKKRRGIEMTRVSAEVYPWLEARLLNIIDRMIDSHPSIGKTIKPE